MKKIYILVALAVFTTSSCDKGFLERAPKDSYTDETYYQTEAQFKLAVIAAYAPLRDVLINDYFTSEAHSDNVVYQPIPSNRGTAYVERENISDFKSSSTNAYVAATWQHCYTGISRANIVIERLAAATGISVAGRASIDGQAKFLRALNYFKLVRLFGGVPLFLKEVTKADDAFLPRSTEAEVYAQIVKDAQDAITELLPPTGFPQKGEATRGSAVMLLADVYVTQKKWADAEGLLTTLSGMGYGLQTNYADAFLIANKNSKESLFEIQFLEGTTTGTTPNVLGFNFLPRSSSTAMITGIAINNGSTGGWNTPSSDLIATYEANDKRLDASIGIAEGTYNASDMFTYSSPGKSIVGYVPAAGKIGVPYIKKYIHGPMAFNTGSSDNFPIYRYSDALLLLAEAQNEQGKPPHTALNAVRFRAGLPITPLTVTDQATLRGIISHERRVELAFENHRWHDLTRTGTAISVINAFGVKIRAEQPFLSSDSYIMTTSKLLFQIPQTELDLNPKITPNP